VPKHRMSEIEPSRASAWTHANTAEDWPEAVGYGQFAGSTGPMGGMPEPGWAASPPEHSWQELEEWQNWGPPAMHPDHPSAPVPRIQLSDDYPSGPMPRPSGPPDLPRRRPGGSARAWNPPPQAPDAGFDNGNRRLYAVPDSPPVEDYAPPALRAPENQGRRHLADLAGPDWPETVDFQPRQGPSSREAIGYQRQTFPGWQEPSDYRPESGPFETGRGPAAGRFPDGRTARRDSTAGQVLTLADGRAAQIAQEAQDYADAVCDEAERQAAAITEQATGQATTIREAAERQAATMREAAERELAELRARLDSMTGELSRVAAYVTENLVAPAMPATAPALPGATPALPGTRPAPDGMPAKPGTRPAGPRTAPASQPHGPGTRTAKPGSAPGTRTAKPGSAPGTRPAGQLDTHGRQRKAMRGFVWATAGLVAFATIAGATEIAQHGFGFFAFRAGGFGETPGGITDQQFEAHDVNIRGNAIPAAHTAKAPTGKHHKTSP
jgi:hypothetical protein